MNFIYNLFQWVYYWLIAYYIILFPLVDNRHCRYTGWHNKLDAFDYNALGLRFDEVSNIYTDLFSNQYWYDHNEQIYWNLQGMRFDTCGLSYSSDQSRAIDFLGNHYYWCFTRNRYIYAKLWSSRLMGHSLIKASFQPMTGPKVAAQVFLLKNPLELTFLKTRLTGLVLSSTLIVNLIGEVNMINQNQPLKSEPTQVVAEFRFQNTETFKQSKAQNTRPLSNRLYKKSTRVSASANTSTHGFDLDSPALTISVSSNTDPSVYSTVNLLQDFGKCLDTHTQTFLADKQKKNITVDPSLKTGIQKLYKQIDIAINIAREKQEWFKQFGEGEASLSTSESLVERLNDSIQKRAFDQNGNTRKNLNLNQTVAQQLREKTDLSLSGIQSFLAIKDDPEAVLTTKEKKQITHEFAKTSDGAQIKAMRSIRAHIIPTAWSIEPRRETQTKALSIKLPFKRFSEKITDNNENVVTTPKFLEKLLDDLTNAEAGVFPSILQQKYVYNPAWTLEKNYLIANAVHEDFYISALSAKEKRLVIQKRNEEKKSKENNIARNY